MSSFKKLIAVIGATGQQGGSLVKAILNDGEFACRAVIRDVNSAKAEELRQLGVETVAGNVDDVDALTKAIEGSYGMFAVSFPVQVAFDPVAEQKQINVMAEAAKRAGIKHVVWSTLEDTRKLIPLDDPRMPTIHGKYKVPHYDCKAEGESFFTDRGLATSYVSTAGYWENYVNPANFGMCWRKGRDGNSVVLALPIGEETLHVGIAVDDIGKCALAHFKRPDLYIGKTVWMCGEALTLKQVAEKMSKATGRKIEAYNIPIEQFRNFGFPSVVEIANMFQYYTECEKDVIKLRDPQETRKVNPEQMNLDQWLAKNADKLPLPEQLY